MAKHMIKFQNLCKGQQSKVSEEEVHWTLERDDGILITRGGEQGLKNKAWTDKKDQSIEALSQMAGRFCNG